MSVPEDLAKSGYVVYQKTTEGMPWWAKFLLVAGLGAGAVYGAYYVINNFINPKPIPPPGMQQLIADKQQFYTQWLQTYNNFTQNGTKALTQDEINTLNAIQSEITYYNEEINKRYKEELDAQIALTQGIEDAAVNAVYGIVAGAVGYGLSKYALKQWFSRKPPGKSNTADQNLGDAVQNANKTPSGQESNTAQALSSVELTIGVELLSYGYQLAGYTSNAINILNAYIPIATEQYNNITNIIAQVSDLYAAGQLTQNDFINTQLSLNVSLVATYALLIYYSVEGFTTSVSSWMVNTVNTATTNALLDQIAEDAVMAVFAVVIGYALAVAIGVAAAA